MSVAPDRLRRAVDRRERRAQLVRDGRDELGLERSSAALLGQVAERVDRPVVEPDARDREPELAAVELERHRLGAHELAGPLATGISGDELRPAGQHLVDAAAHDLVRVEARDRPGGGVPEPDDAFAVDEEHAVADRGEHSRRLRALLGLRVELRVVDRDRRARGELAGELELRDPVDTARLRLRERDRAEHAVAGDQRHADVRAQAELTDQLGLRLVESLAPRALRR